MAKLLHLKQRQTKLSTHFTGQRSLLPPYLIRVKLNFGLEMLNFLLGCLYLCADEFMALQTNVVLVVCVWVEPLTQTSLSQPKHIAESEQNSTGSLPPQPKGKKRERSYQVSEPLKQEHSSGTDRYFGNSKSEIAKIAEPGGLVDFEGVGRLVQLMHPNKPLRKLDLTSRMLIADVIAAMGKFDCLSRFVRLRGLPVLDEYLQEVHKINIGDSSSTKD
ncbi:hypothetical protein Nepgr_018647 [Nepenthes gracilis]|uniref:Uncharacterized protein n=1 Tax=Nepenthes gracilis TaxID=150966 RepID=A0AAD3SVM1_NEPGR|nr:hypothetical protein Nepgr_018647 [Nepenthes gracilis]